MSKLDIENLQSKEVCLNNIIEKFENDIEKRKKDHEKRQKIKQMKFEESIQGMATHLNL